MSPAGDIDHRSFRHWGGFIFSGATAFFVDLGATEFLHHRLEVDRISARFLGILIATVVAWLMHRRISFNVPYPPSLQEFGRFFLAASAGNMATFGAYWLVFHMATEAPILVAVIVSSALGGAISYVLFRFGVFRQQPATGVAPASVPAQFTPLKPDILPPMP